MQANITITDPDRRIDFVLQTTFNVRTNVPPRAGWRDGGDPGESAAVEIEAVRCLETVTWCGSYGISSRPAEHALDQLETRLGQWCLAEYASEIEQEAWSTYQRLRDSPWEHSFCQLP